MKLLKLFISLILLLVISANPSEISAAGTEDDFCSQFKGQSKIWWDGIELKPGQIGRLSIKQNTPLFKLEGEKKTISRTLKAGEFYRIYAFKPGMLSVGGGYYVDRDVKITYQTPSKTKLAAVKCINNPLKAVSYKELEKSVIYEGDLGKIEKYLSNYDDKDDLSKLLAQVSYLSTDRNRFGYNEIAVLLLNSGADPNFEDFQGFTPLSHAVLQQNAGLAKILIEAGASTDFINPISGEQLIDEVYETGNSDLIRLFEENWVISVS
ncbi:ankyrin repeat domain-containing protein [Cytobacillus sp. SAFR-174]|uniref:ankyrin repeat domain-containing protein n=1 Tax=Cytobacillus sp. SAFR-174 TaxID=3436868 RepID=UPI003F7E4501